MKALKHMGLSMLLLVTVTLFGCGDENGVKPPPPPLQLKLQVYRSPTLPNNDVYDVLVDSKDRIWFCTGDGLGMKDGTQWHYFNQPEGLPVPMCRNAIEFNGKIWVTTWGGGVAVYNDTTWTVLGESEKVFDVAIDAYEPSIWFGLVDGVIQYFDDEAIPMQNRWIDHSDKVLHPQVKAIEMAESTPRGFEIWFGALNNWVSVWRPAVQVEIHYTAGTTGIPGTGVTDIAYNPQDDLFWVAFSSHGLASVDVERSTWRHYTTEDGIPSMIVYSLAVDDDGVVWIGTQRGVAKYDGSSFTAYVEGSGLMDSRIRKVRVDHNNNVWLAMIEGGAARIIR